MGLSGRNPITERSSTGLSWARYRASTNPESTESIKYDSEQEDKPLAGGERGSTEEGRVESRGATNRVRKGGRITTQGDVKREITRGWRYQGKSEVEAGIGGEG
ncbi:hypothetical protein AMTR_s00088p00085370 [Amborella trichopoda]|uniref:Uncharacterized protein n=1 Tax=Amborella trichopoda TaxID=13333 RepID=W1NV93_AMBTC|nr:hypothetical protein AMTR_s00088p00085370 [Amborella trichopoda]